MKNLATRERAEKCFNTELGQQLDMIYMTSDGEPFIRYKEAIFHLKEETPDLENKTIYEFYKDEE